MRERYEPALKVACAVLAAVLLFELVRVVVQGNPLGHLTIPALPALAASETTNAIPAQGVVKGGAAKDGGAPSGGATNGVAKGAPTAGKGTNATVSQASGAAKDGGAPSGKGATNDVAKGVQVAGKG